jgi:nicotinate-nucleotide--dimethylbenzimidazole phosphoribosyltransferase
MKKLQEALQQIKSLDEEAMQKSKDRVDNLIKPIGSLGKLEEIVVQLAGITGSIYPSVDKKSVIVMAADHGVCEEGVAAAPQDVTFIQTLNISRGITGVCALSNISKADVVIVDIGVKKDIENENIINRKINYGTGNIAKGHAMTREEAVRSVEIGIEMACREFEKGKNILATGEMGIGNTTPSSAILSLVTGLDPSEVTGVGANLPNELVGNKSDVIRRAIKINCPDKNDPLDILSKVGGYDIGGMTGIIIGAAACGIPVVVDGFISTISAILAIMLEPKARGYILPSHISNEKASRIASEYIGLKPFLDLNMRLGEGSGAALAFSIIEAATDMNRIMITFEESGIKAV